MKAQPKPNPNAKQKPRRIVRKGIRLADWLAKIELKNSKLVGPKQVFLPNCQLPMNYYEREAVAGPGGTSNTSIRNGGADPPTLLLFHGIGSNAREFCVFLKMLQVPAHIRILVPEMVGMGEDMKRAFAEGSSYEHPGGITLLETMSEFLDVVHAGSNCNALGTSLGGALLYFLAMKEPGVFSKTILLAPALPAVLTDAFLGGLLDGSHRFMDFHDAEDVKTLFRYFLWTETVSQQGNAHDKDNAIANANGDASQTTKKPNRKKKKKKQKKDPFPFSKLVYEIIYQMTLRDVPEGHYKAIQDKLINEYGRRIMSKSSTESDFHCTSHEHETANDNDIVSDNADDMFVTTTDLDPHRLRLVVWPEEDQICSIAKGRQFFASPTSTNTTFREIPECGHVFHSDGTPIYAVVAPIVREFLLDFEP